MAYPGYPPSPPAGRPVSTGDVVVSVVVLVLTALAGALGAFLGVFSLAFLDYCPPESCSVDGAVSAVGTTLLVAFLIGVAGLVATIVALARRKPGWPFALGTFVLCLLTFAVGVLAYGAAVGG